MNTTKVTWLVRPYPHNILRIDEFRQKNIVAIGWPGLGNLAGKSREELKRLLAQPPYSYSDRKLGSAYATIDIFVNQMRAGDLVLVPDGDDIYLGELTSDYRYDQAMDNDTDGYPHQRTVSWLPVNISREDLSRELRISLKAPRTAANLSKHGHDKEIAALALGQARRSTGTDAAGTTAVSYPLRPGHTITFSIPNDITRQEAQRLSDYFASLYFVE